MNGRAQAVIETPLKLDRTGLLARVGGNTEMLADLAGLFFGDGPERLAAVRQAVASADPAAVQETAHHLIGALALFGAPAAVDAAGELESLARSGALFRAGAVFASGWKPEPDTACWRPYRLIRRKGAT